MGLPWGNMKSIIMVSSGRETCEYLPWLFIQVIFITRFSMVRCFAKSPVIASFEAESGDLSLLFRRQNFSDFEPVSSEFVLELALNVSDFLLFCPDFRLIGIRLHPQ